MNNILEVENLTVGFDGKKVLDGLSFSLKDKENLVIVGPNGAGKSVLLRALLGTVSFDGDVKWQEGVKIGYVPQRFSPEREIPLSVREFFSFKTKDEDEIKKALKSVGIRDFSILEQKIGVISSGQLQRILIAWGLIGDPDVLLFDEPTAGIDVEGEGTIYSLLAEVEKEKDLTILLITHDLSVVYKLADSVLCLNKKAVCYGAPQEALSSKNLKELYGEEVKVYPHTHD